MKKPLILLVDDDPAVLCALEAALTPAFAAICRIETFTEPGEVLSALPGWVADKRPLALAVVDQKMPGMSGVELLQALRGESACATMKAILLTGYAGLDSAVAAKNTGGIDQYLEKPWQARALTDYCRDVLADGLATAGVMTGYSFRPVITESALVAHFQVRHEVYRESRLNEFLNDQDDLELDIDPYDLTATHFGLFFFDGGAWRLIGTHRIVSGEAGPSAPALAGLAAADGRIRNRLARPRGAELPMMEYSTEQSAAAAFAERVMGPIAAEGERLFEATRFAISPTHRRGARESLFVARHVIASQVARYFLLAGVRHGFTLVVDSSARFYAAFGFLPEFHYLAHDLPFAVLHATRDTIPEETVAQCSVLAERIRRTDAACCCASFTECVGSSYVSDDFTSADIFCPLLAQRLLKEDVRT